MIYIFTGAIRSGKTTALLDWVEGRDDVDGLLSPDGSEGKRYFLKVKSQEKFQQETDSKTEDVVVIGPFRFLKSSFKKANDLLISFASEIENRYLILDELGKLELKNQGIHDSAEVLIPRFINDETKHLILVVRDYLLDAIIEHYNILEYKLLKTEDVNNLN